MNPNAIPTEPRERETVKPRRSAFSFGIIDNFLMSFLFQNAIRLDSHEPQEVQAFKCFDNPLLYRTESFCFYAFSDKSDLTCLSGISTMTVINGVSCKFPLEDCIKAKYKKVIVVQLPELFLYGNPPFISLNLESQISETVILIRLRFETDTLPSQRMDQFATIERRTLSSLVEQYLQGPKDKRIPRDAHLTKVLDNMGYQYQGNEVGGNCFYLALADQLQKDPAEIRRLLAEWLSHNRNYLAEEGEVDLWNGVMPFLYTD